MSRLVDDEMLADGTRLLLIEDDWPCPTDETSVPINSPKRDPNVRYIHPCTLNNPEHMPKCSICGDYIPVPEGFNSHRASPPKGVAR